MFQLVVIRLFYEQIRTLEPLLLSVKEIDGGKLHPKNSKPEASGRRILRHRDFMKCHGKVAVGISGYRDSPRSRSLSAKDASRVGLGILNYCYCCCC